MYKMLTDIQMKDLASRMGVPLEFIGFKSDIPLKLKANRSYIINLEDALSKDGAVNKGSHWTCFQVREYPNKVKEAIYFDSYGVGPPQVVCKRIEKNFGCGVYHTEKDIQSLMSEVCGYYCLAFLHFINESPYASKHLIQDADTFMDMFDDLEKNVDFKKNEYVLKHFFMSKDPAMRKSVDVIEDDVEDTMRAQQSEKMMAEI